MLICEFANIQKGKFYGTELPIIEESSHTYKNRGKNVRRKGRSHQELGMRNKRMSTARQILDEGYNADNPLLLSNGNLKLDIQPYLDHYNKSGWGEIPGGRGMYSSEKNDDRRTRIGWVQDLESAKWKQRTKRNTLKAIQAMLFKRRVDPMSWSHKPNYKKINDKVYGPGEG